MGWVVKPKSENGRAGDSRSIASARTDRIRLGVEFELEHVMGSDQPADRPRGIGDDDKQASLALLGKVERRLKEHVGQSGIGYRPFPERKLRFRVEHPPAAVGEDKRLHSTGEHLDLLVRAEHQADMAAGPRGQRMKRVNPGARNRENRPCSRSGCILNFRLRRPVLAVRLVMAQCRMSTRSVSLPCWSTRKTVLRPSQSRCSVFSPVSSTPNVRASGDLSPDRAGRVRRDAGTPCRGSAFPW